jgi:hypothetical protein
MKKPLSDSSSLNISLGMLMQAVVGIASIVWIYAQLSGDINSIINRLEVVEKDVQDNYQWREDWQSGGILPLDVSQNEKIAYLEKEVERLRNEQ